MKPENTKSISVGDLCTIAVFVLPILCLLFASIPSLLSNSSGISVEEKRNLSTLPKLELTPQSLKTFPAAFEAYLNDRLAMRQSLVTASSLIKYEAFAVSTSPLVLPGKDGWMYYTDEADMHTLRHSAPFSEEQSAERARIIEARRLWLAQKNIKYLVVIAPSKCTIYPEFVPDAYTALKNESRREQLLKQLKQYSAVDVIDVTPTLLAQKTRGQLYYKTDTHWNLLGSWLATQQVMQRVRSWFPVEAPLTEAYVEPIQHHFTDGDLSQMLGLHGIVTEQETLWQPKCGYLWKPSSHPPFPDLSNPVHAMDSCATEVADAKLPKVVFLRDSFMAIPRVYFSNFFKRAYYEWTQDFPSQLIKAEKPDLVIEEFTERKLVGATPKNPAEVDAVLTPDSFATIQSRHKVASRPTGDQ